MISFTGQPSFGQTRNIEHYWRMASVSEPAATTQDCVNLITITRGSVQVARLISRHSEAKLRNPSATLLPREAHPDALRAGILPFGQNGGGGVDGPNSASEGLHH
jgi:hypothetical protein